MKVTGPGSGLPPEANEVGGPTGSGEAVGKDGGKAFAEKLERGGAAEHARDPAASATTSAAGAPSVADIGAELRAGTITPEKALDQVIARILDKQVGAHAPPAVRAQVEAALRDAVASDPLLIEKVKAPAG